MARSTKKRRTEQKAVLIALENAKYLINLQINENGKTNLIFNNPLTTIYQLVEYLNSLYDAKKNNYSCYPIDELKAAHH